MNAARFRENERRLWEANGAAPVERHLRLATLGIQLRVREVGDGPPIHGAALQGVGRLAAVVPPTDMAARAVFRNLGHGATLQGRGHRAGRHRYGEAWMRDTDTMRNGLAMRRNMMSLRRGIDPRLVFDDSNLARISMPSLFLWGTNDPFGGADVARRFVARVPGAELDLLEGMGYAPWLDDPDGCAARVEDFLGGS